VYAFGVMLLQTQLAVPLSPTHKHKCTHTSTYVRTLRSVQKLLNPPHTNMNVHTQAHTYVHYALCRSSFIPPHKHKFTHTSTYVRTLRSVQKLLYPPHTNINLHTQAHAYVFLHSVQKVPFYPPHTNINIHTHKHIRTYFYILCRKFLVIPPTQT